jgi:hypothetical protein
MVVSLPIGPSPLWAVEWTVFLPLLYLVLAFLVGAAVIAIVQRWRRRQTSLGPSASDQLAQFRTLYEQGAISEEEYRRLRSILTGELRKEIDLPARPPSLGPAPVQQVMPPPADKPAPDSDQPPAPGIKPA